MLKFLIKKNYVDFNKILLENYTKMDISEHEVIIILNLVELFKVNKCTLSTTALAKKTKLSIDECSNNLNSLLNKGLISLDIEYTNKKAKEVFNLDFLFKSIDKLFNDEIKVQTIEKTENNIRDIIDIVEKHLNKNLSPYELEVIIEWSKNNVSIEKIKKALDISLSKNIVNLKYIDKIINSTETTDVVNEEESKVLDDIFRNIR